ncbi:hypothetical protein L0663_17495 [Dyadobacter sp. CY107]|uniref:hypothetical protein n=1 Tax=Dyadobacter fanqingshengii TaxID=2906443 RepID=UPI001F21EF85|nr:hypothetical protein [Dyadobacter fanqingshengii]MCF2505192.1 hypothetical protein [Dyadobacter fanqingshengii]
MKHSLTPVKTLVFSCLLLLFSCNNDNQGVNPADSNFAKENQVQENLKTNASLAFDITACNMLIKLFNPPANARYVISNGFFGPNFRTFGVRRTNVPDYNFVDIVNFEYSGKNFGKGGVAKLYRIRRSDGLFLTQYDHANLSYKPRSTSTTSEKSQLWIIRDLGNKKYKLILPTLATGCEVAGVNHDGDTYRFVSIPSNLTYADQAFGLEPYFKLPTNPN